MMTLVTLQCPYCTHPVGRVHRTPLEKILYTAVHQCASCGRRTRDLRPQLDWRIPSAILHRWQSSTTGIDGGTQHRDE
jgi:C4-type Zn-finger protein